MTNRVKPALIAATLLLSAGAVIPVSASPVPQNLGSLTFGSELFWAGGYVGNSPTHSLPLVSVPIDRCATLGPCFAYTLTVSQTSGTARLRVGFDTPARDDGFEMTVTSPAGAATTSRNSNAYSMEQVFVAPATGTWTISVAPSSADNASFRMRAKLEAAAPAPVATGDHLLPNLRVTRIWEFGFAAPANPGNGLFPPDDVNPPLSVAGQQPISCAVDEQVEDGAKRCLRFSFGLGNVGWGNFDIRFSGDRLNPYAMTQCLQRADNALPDARPAGTGSFHKTHGHFHYDNIIAHEVFRVFNRAGTGPREAVGDGRKLGYSPADQGIPEWYRFDNGPPQVSSSAGNCSPGSQSRLGMSPGWGDAYRYQRPGNYVYFDKGSDGYYVVRTIADPQNDVLESNEADNVSYALIQIIGEEINVLESGRGEGPWDPQRILFEQ